MSLFPYLSRKRLRRKALNQRLSFQPLAESLEDRRLLTVGDLLDTILSPDHDPQGQALEGFSVAASSDYLVTGKLQADTTQVHRTGAVEIYDATSHAHLMTIENPTQIANERFGTAVAVSGQTVVVGADAATVGTSSVGAVYVFDLSSGAANLTATIPNPRPSNSDRFGNAIAISGNTVVVGAYDDYNGTNTAGSAYIYDLSGGTATLLATLESPTALSSDDFGLSVDVSGDSVVIGARGAQTGGVSAGIAYRYQLSAGVATLVETIENPTPASGDQFGSSVAIDGNTVVVGATSDDSVASNAGSAYVFDISSGSAALVETIANPTLIAGDQFGAAVDVRGNMIVVGSPYSNDAGVLDTGSAYVFDRSSGTATLVASLKNPSPTNSVYFGRAVAVSDTAVMVGSPYDDTGATDAGTAFLYDLVSDLSTPTAAINHPTIASDAGDRFGLGVAVDGNTAVIGAPDDQTGARFSGRAYVYDVSTGTASLVTTIDNPDPGYDDNFGQSVAVSGDKVVVGAWGDATGASYAGSAYVFDLAAGAATRFATLHNPSPAANDYFGWSVAVSGDTAVVGAFLDDTGASDAGSVYVYDLSGESAVLLATVNNPHPATGDRFGYSVDISGDLIVVGEQLGKSVYVYDVYNLVSGDVTPRASINNPIPEAVNSFGYPVVISEATVVVGAPSGNSQVSGKAFVYDVSGEAPLLVTTIDDPRGTNDGFAGSLAISENSIMVGARDDSTGAISAGSAYLYNLSNGTASLVATIDNPTPAANDDFGYAVAIDRDTILIGALDDDTKSTNAGAAYLFAGPPLDPLLVTSVTDAVDPNDHVTSLREAILYANGNPGVDTIRFQLPGAGPYTIQPQSQLPDIVDPIVIDGSTQPGFSGSPVIELDGSGVIGNGLMITGGSSTVRGLAINRFAVYGIELAFGGGNTIQDNHLGTDVTGTVARGNQTGIGLNQSSDNVIGSNLDGNDDDFERNVISGNSNLGIYTLVGSDRNLIAGNYIGTDASGTTSLGNAQRGIVIGGGVDMSIQRNVISGNGLDGILLNHVASTNAVIQGNLIGTDATGASPLGNGANGIFIAGPHGVMVGGTEAGEGNTIAFNSNSGVYVSGTRIQNRISGNSIFANGRLGIDLKGDDVTLNDVGDGDTGANELQNFPELSGALSFAGNTIAEGNLNSRPNTTYTLELFANAELDPSGYGEGQTYLGSAVVATDGTGNANFSTTLAIAVPIGQYITATATDPAGNTSEFSIGSPVATATSRVHLVGDDLVIEDEASLDNQFTISIDTAGAISLADSSGARMYLDGVNGTGSASNSVTIGPGQFTGKVILLGHAGDDRLIVDFAEGGAFPMVQFDGGANNSSTVGDQLELRNGSFADATFTFENANVGTIDLTGQQPITFTGLEPLTSMIQAENVTLQYLPAAGRISVTDGGSGTTAASANGATVTFVSPSAALRVVNSGGLGSSVDLNGLSDGFDAELAVTSDVININAPIDTGTGAVTLAPFSNGATIVLDSRVTTGFNLRSIEIGWITTPVLVIGSETSGPITINEAIAPAAIDTLFLKSGDTVSVSVGKVGVASPAGIAGSIRNLAVDAAGDILLNSSSNSAQTVALHAANGTVSYDSGPGFTVGRAGNLEGIVASDSINLNTQFGTGGITIAQTGRLYDLEAGRHITLSAGGDEATLTVESGASLYAAANSATLIADKMNVAGTVQAEEIRVRPWQVGQPIELGSIGDAQTNRLELSNHEVNQLVATTLKIGSANSGPISLSDLITPGSPQTLSLTSGGGIDDGVAGGIIVPQLAVRAVDSVYLDNATTSYFNSIQTVAAQVTGAGSGFVLENKGALAIGSVDGLSGIQTNGGGITVITHSPLTIDQPILEQGGGSILLNATNDGGDDDNLTVSAAIQAAGGGNIELMAGTNLILGGGITVSVTDAGTIAASAQQTTEIAANASLVSASGPISLDTASIIVTGTTTSDEVGVQPVGDTGSVQLSINGVVLVANPISPEGQVVTQVVATGGSTNTAPLTHAGADRSITEGDVLAFTGSFTDPDIGDNHAIVWDFGDGTDRVIGTLTAEHRFAEDGDYTVSLIVTDSAGVRSRDTLIVTVANAAPEVAAQDDEQIEDYEWALLTREVTFVDPGLLDQHFITVDFGDHSPPQHVAIPLGERSIILEHPYSVTPGASSDYVVSVQIDDDVASGSVSFGVAVTDRTLSEPDQRPVVQFSRSSYSVTENSGTLVSVDAMLSSPALQRLEIPARLTDSTAIRDVDYLLSDTVFVFDVGQSVAGVTFADIDDLLDEPAIESATLAFESTASGVLLGSISQTTLQVLDDDLPPAVYFNQAASTHSEGDTFELTVELTGISDTEVRVPLSVTSATAQSRDYTLSSSLIVIPPGTRNGSVTLTIEDDTEPETAESLTIAIVEPVVGAELRSVAGAQTRHTASIRANDTLLAELTTSTNRVSEGDGSFEVTITLDGPAPESYVVPVAVTSSSAVVPHDYYPLATITIAAGESTASSTITLNDDTISERLETLDIRLGNALPSGLVRGGLTSATVQIVDDDAANIEFSDTEVITVYEDEKPFSLSVTTGGVTFDHDVQVPFSVVRLSPSGYYNGSYADLIGPTGSIRIPAGSTSGSITLQPKDDAISPKNEASESFDFHLGSVTAIPGAQLGENATRRVTVLDDDPLVTISANKTGVGEGYVDVLYTVQLSAKTNQQVTIPFDVYGSAKRDYDYVVYPAVKSGYRVFANYVEIDAGQTTAVIRVRTSQDNVFEGKETAGIKLVPQYGSTHLANALLGTPNADFVSIYDDDGIPTPTISVVRGKQPGSSSYSSTSSWINEGGSFRVTVTLANPASKSVFVPIRFPDASGRATSNDFTTGGLSKGILKIPAYATRVNFYIYTIDDTRPEDKEKIRITMGQPTDYKGNPYGQLPDREYTFVGINPSDTATTTCSDTATAGTLALNTCVGTVSTSTSGDSTLSPTTTSLPITGTGSLALSVSGYREGGVAFLDGNFSGTRDFVDLNGDGVQSDDEPDEPLAVTNPDGSFEIYIPVEFDRNGNGVLNADEAQLVVVGGTDTSTGLPQETRLVAAPGDYVTTALTTVAAKLVQQHGMSLQDAHTRVLDALSLPDFEMGATAVPHATLAGNLSAATSYPATAALENAAVVIAHYLDGVGQAGVELLADLVYEQVAILVASPGAFIDLSSASALENLAIDTGARLGYGDFNSRSTALAEGLAGVNREILQLPVTTDLAFLDAVVRRKIVARGAMATDASALGASSLSETEFADRYSSQALLELIAAAQPGTIEPIRFGVSDASIIEGDDGTTYAEFEVFVSEHFTGPVSIEYASEPVTADDEASAAVADYHSASGLLQWQPGDEPRKIIQVPVFGDTFAELDETFQLQIFNASSGLIQRAIGRGTIRGDDAVLVQLDPAVQGSDVKVFIDGDSIAVDQHGRLLVDGELNPGTALVIQTGAEAEAQVFVDMITASNPPRVVQVVSQGLNDSLYVSNGATMESERQVVSTATGRLHSDGLVLDYTGFSQVSDEHTPVLRFDSEPALGAPLNVTSIFPDVVNTEGVLFTWTVELNGETMLTGNGAGLDLTPANPGTYDVLLRADYIDGSVAISRQSFEIANPNLPPVADPGGPYDVPEGGTIQLDASASTDPDLPNETLIYAWDLDGDGLFGETGAEAERGAEVGVNPVFDAVGLDGPSTFHVELLIIDSFGESNQAGVDIAISNVAPSIGDLAVELVENSVSGTTVAVVSATDAGFDEITYSIVGGSGATAFEIDTTSGLVTVSDSSWLDYEATHDLTLLVRATDDDGGSSMSTVVVHLLNQASISGVVFVDVNEDGVFQADEPGIDGAVIELRDSHGDPVLDAHGAAITALTDSGGFYLFEDLDPAIYQLHELQPTGVDDGEESIGSLQGIVIENDVMQLSLARTNAYDYAFAELGGELTSGQSAGIGFWQNKHGQQLIAAGGSALANWLSTNFGNIFGNIFVGANGDQVATFYRDQLFFQKSHKSNEQAKVDAQFMATALSVYFTNRKLAGEIGADYGFAVNDTGLGGRVINVGSRGAAFGVADGTNLTVTQLLHATDGLTDLPDQLSGFAAVYDKNGDGVIDADEARLRELANELYSWINSF